MSNHSESGWNHDQASTARLITKAIVESLEAHLESIIKRQIYAGTLELHIDNPEIYVDASLVGRRYGKPFAEKIHVAPLKLPALSASSTPSLVRSDTESYLSQNFTIHHDVTPGSHIACPTLPLPTGNPENELGRPFGGLRSRGGTAESPEDNQSRQLQRDVRNTPKRHKINEDRSVMKPSTLDKLVASIWEQIHSSLQLDPQAVSEQWTEPRLITADSSTVLDPGSSKFSKANTLCRKVTQASRCCRSLEVIVQAHWISCYDERVRSLAEKEPHISLTKHKVAVLKEACEDFGWTEKDLRNKMAVWRGYHEIEQAGGWVPLVFAGMGLYRYCKYRVDFSPEALFKLAMLRPAFEVAADTLHPQWRELLSIVGQPTVRRYTGHPHDWVIQEGGAVPLKETYLQWDPHFSFEHLSESALDKDKWGEYDPRSFPHRTDDLVKRQHICDNCGSLQSEIPQENSCVCFPNLYGARRGPVPVQVFRTSDGKNNGLMALCGFPRGTAIGEFVGVVTSAIKNLDCMQSSVDDGPTYQIYQGRKGNFTRFINHSCLPNAQYERFTWLGLQRIVLVSKGIDAGQEITVDYGDGYWQNLDKICQCGESCCRYRNRRVSTVDE
ncbi:uncharacterized protein PV09_08887 [Verruconis gallopava]|uniref:SET domain-containing protein n=1 Tax=Verruconis gallopava TaxID=253628 RepID=A0A0D1YFD3_9PEZI|nr:uncharacterized protein PV09_08887 [Verruconis gallopava]KIV99466.1 hypothetical protein PV09_08887 [Verruconis gallopava]